MHHSPFFQRLWCITSLPVSTDHSPLLLVASYALHLLSVPVMHHRDYASPHGDA